jgi:hypothetical protein
MALIRLNPGASVQCSLGEFVLDCHVDGADADVLTLQVTQQAQPDQPAAAVNRAGVAQLVVAALPVAVDVVAVPTTGQNFGNDVIVSAQVTLLIGGNPVSQYSLPRINVSGTPFTTLVTISPFSGYAQLDVPLDAVVARQHETSRPPVPVPAGSTSGRPAEPAGPAGSAAPAEHPVHSAETGLAQQAAYAARRRAGSGKLPADQRTHLFLAVDRSASFLPAVRSGAAQCLLEVLVGVNEVTGVDNRVHVFEAAAVARPVRQLTTANLDGYWTDVLGDQAHTGGVLTAALVAETDSATDRRTVVVITDGLPPDLDELTQALSAARAAGTRTRLHLLCIAKSVADPETRREPWRDELAAVGALRDEGLLTCSAITPGTGEGWLRSHLSDGAVLDAVVSALPFWSGV